MMNRGSKYALLPVYLVLDTSYSMEDDNKFDAALSFLPKLLSCMTGSSSLSDKIRVELITFDDEARVELALGGLNEMEKWMLHNKKDPIMPKGDATYYGKAFEKLKSRIQLGVRQIQDEKIGDDNFKAYRPVVFFITDGAPNDIASVRSEAYAKLTSQNFEYRPNIVCVGVGEAKHEDLAGYGAGRQNSPTGAYITGNDRLVIVPRDGILSSTALNAIIPALVTTIVKSFNNSAHLDNFSGVPDLFGTQDDLDDLIDKIDWGDE